MFKGSKKASMARTEGAEQRLLGGEVRQVTERTIRSWSTSCIIVRTLLSLWLRWAAIEDKEIF